MLRDSFFCSIFPEESVSLHQTTALRKNTAAHDAPGPGQKPGHGAVKDSKTPGNIFLPGIPTASWVFWDVIQKQSHTRFGQFKGGEKTVLPLRFMPPDLAARITIEAELCFLQTSRLFKSCPVNGEKPPPEHDLKRRFFQCVRGAQNPGDI